MISWTYDRKQILQALRGALTTAVLAAFAWPDTPLEGSVYKIRAGIGYHNCVVKVGCIGLNDKVKVTGTGVDAVYGSAVQSQDPTPWPGLYWMVHVERIEVLVGGSVRTAQVYPLASDPSGAELYSVARAFRFDSTVFAASVGGTPAPLTVRATIHYLQWDPLEFLIPEFTPAPIAEETKAFDLTVTPTAFNVLLVNATDQNVGGSPQGWQAMNTLPEGYTWGEVSPNMALKARESVPADKYAPLLDDLHGKAGLVLPASPPGERWLKLLGQSTAFFNSSHGKPTGISDKTAADANWLSWADIERTSGHNIVFEAKDPAKPGELDLLNRFVFLYSCDCGVGASPLGAFHLGGANTALFGFNDSVFSTLAAGNTQDNLAYNDDQGNLLLTDKLSGHVNVLLGRLASGWKPTSAINDANGRHPPRAFWYGAGGINYTRVLNMLRAGNADATLTTIYRAGSETDANWLQLGNWGLVGKALMPMPSSP